MSPEVVTPASARSATVVNEEIRALWARLGGRPTTPEERAEYERLVVEWAAAARTKVTAAA
jgi:hypothetical protein